MKVMVKLYINFRNGLSTRFIAVHQGFATCGTRRSRSSRRYASHFHFFTKTWIQSFLVYVSGFVSKQINFPAAGIPIVS